jgi:uncharacterized protein YoxC
MRRHLLVRNNEKGGRGVTQTGNDLLQPLERLAVELDDQAKRFNTLADEVRDTDRRIQLLQASISLRTRATALRRFVGDMRKAA